MLSFPCYQFYFPFVPMFLKKVMAMHIFPFSLKPLGRAQIFFYRNHKLKCSLEFIKYAIIKLLNELEDFLIAALLSFLYREHERRIQKRRQQIDFTSQAFYAHGDLRIGLKDGAETWRNHSLF